MTAARDIRAANNAVQAEAAVVVKPRRYPHRANAGMGGSTEQLAKISEKIEYRRKPPVPTVDKAIFGSEGSLLSEEEEADTFETEEESRVSSRCFIKVLTSTYEFQSLLLSKRERGTRHENWL